MTVCVKCHRTLNEGDNAWAADWKIIDTSGEKAVIRTETRYMCDDCEATS